MIRSKRDYASNSKPSLTTLLSTWKFNTTAYGLPVMKELFNVQMFPGSAPGTVSIRLGGCGLSCPARSAANTKIPFTLH